MRKLICMLLAVMILLASTAALGEHQALPQYISVGDVLAFGHYEQDNNPDNGPEPIEWIVLDVQDGKALLLSRYGLEARPYNTEDTDVTWETCTLRSWLNSEFLTAAFSPEEQSAVMTTAVDNSDAQGNSDYDTSGGNDTEDRIFLLSYAEADRYFGSRTSDQAIAVPTAHAAASGAEVYDDGTASGWLLRSPGYEQDYVATYGSFYYGCSAGDGSVAVRPVFWVNLESEIFLQADAAASLG